MRCNICGQPTFVVTRSEAAGGLREEVQRRCKSGHNVLTHEVHTTMVADEREMRSALRYINQRIARFNRDIAIACDGRPATQVAADHKITEARVRQIRASFQSRAPDVVLSTIFPENSERTTP